MYAAHQAHPAPPRPLVHAHRAPDPAPVEEPAPQPFDTPHPHHQPVHLPHDEEPVPDPKPS